MKKLLVFFFFSFSFAVSAQTKLTVENGGRGAHKAIITADKNLPDHTIYRSAEMSSSAPLPIVLFGNGGCMNNSEGYQNYLNEIASQGYLVIAVGPFEYFLDDTLTSVREFTKTDKLIEALDWAFKENGTSGSAYYQKLDTKSVATMGHSCGGLQAIEASFDPRVKTTIVLNSGILASPPPEQFRASLPALSLDDLQKIRVPALYLIGGESDVAYTNAEANFERISKTAVVLANYPSGHGGTYREAHGGEYVLPTIAWFNWQLKGQVESKTYFAGEDCDLCQRKDWEVKTKGLQ
ncbi:alpha/beta hydrolase [Jiulongibacter sediminis]|uniref:alpha/beta hydrolase n=1 Tax=Jiulongibacter sediminis TaxID=1605367 RepID=UPI0026F266B9|nr:alpha/beta hydrolase [Jiulongibacter sediminis]